LAVDNIKLDLKDNIFNTNILRNFINDFYTLKVENITDNQHILFLFRLVLINNEIKTVNKLLKINKEGAKADDLISLLFEASLGTLDNYSNSPIKSLIISYGVRKGKIISTISSNVGIAGENNNGLASKGTHIFYNHKLPITINAEDYGDVISKIGDITIVSLKKNINLVIKSENNTNIVKYFKNGKLLYEWTDHIKEDNSLIREIGKTTILWKDNEII
jgi:hypothetical protein